MNTLAQLTDTLETLNGTPTIQEARVLLDSLTQSGVDYDAAVAIVYAADVQITSFNCDTTEWVLDVNSYDDIVRKLRDVSEAVVAL